MNINFIKFEDNIDNYKLMHKWCTKRYIYEWFEQRELSYEEIENKYKNKLLNSDQDLYIITCDDIPIGFTQIYKYDDKEYNIIKDKLVYEFDIFIGEEDYLSKGIGSKVIDVLKDKIYDDYKADYIILRPFARNTRAVKCYMKNDFKKIDEYEGKDTLGNKEDIVVLINKKKDKQLSFVLNDE